MNQFLTLPILALLLASCGDPKPPPVHVATPLEKASADLAGSRSILESDTDMCKNGYHPATPSATGDTLAERQEAGQRALEDWDAVAADDVDNTSPAEEARIRKSLGAQFGLPPSEMNGWKDIYRGRGAAGKRRKAVANEMQLYSCKRLAADRTEVSALTDKVASLQDGRKIEKPQ